LQTRKSVKRVFTPYDLPLIKAERTDGIQQGRGAAAVRKANAKGMKTADSLLNLMSTTHSSLYEMSRYLSVA
jgi:hypothetical protein